ncbi:helix-turn-helix transcriptional regulator [Lysobacter koreensis]|uniref:Helix-turn-helix transcriptional regulator n=1 Tax=Lysobacter koreensis TaxID=266122 RepID=A0ABW2YQI4_9GAMM
MASTRIRSAHPHVTTFADVLHGRDPAAPADVAARHHAWADQGRFIEIGPGREHRRVCWAGLSRFGSIKLAAPAFSVWVQVRGSTQVRAREGAFTLHAGDWIAFDADSAPELQCGRGGLTLGLLLPSELFNSPLEHGLFVGKGRMAARHLAVALRLWRVPMRQLPAHITCPDEMLKRSLRPLALHLAGVQENAIAGLGHCPGYSLTRKRRVFNRMQRAHLYLEGNAHRIVRISELAEITNYSIWYVSKTFHTLYGEGVQAVASRLRIERACELLATTAMDITEVAESCGFDNACSFARAFRARSGTTATEFRLRHRAARRARLRFELGDSARL